MMPAATAEELEEVLGDTDPFIIERILDTHATVDEVVEALAELQDERRFGERREPSTVRAAEVREILEEVIDDAEEDAYAPTHAPPS